MTCNPTQLHYPDPEQTSPCPILAPGYEVTSINFEVIGLTQVGFKPASSGFESAIFRFPNLSEQEVDALVIQPPRLVWWNE